MQFEMTIVTGTRNRPEQFLRFFQSVLDSATVPTEIIVTDASDERTYTIEERLPYRADGPLMGLQVFHEKPRLGTLKGYNVAFRHASGRYVTWFNDDCELEPGWDKIAIDFMDAHPEIGIGAVYFKDRAGETWQRAYGVQSFQGMHYANFGVVRRELGDQIAWFDERTGAKMYGCDNSICLNMLVAGYAVVPIPGCKCKHWRTMDADRQENYRTAEEDARKLGILWNGDYSAAKAAEEKFAHLRQPCSIE